MYRIKTPNGWWGLDRPPFQNWQDAAETQRQVSDTGIECWVEPVTY